MTESAEQNKREILWRAVESGNVKAVYDVVRQHVDVDASNVYGTTALMRAVAKGRKQIVTLLLDHGANPNGVRKDGFTPLLLAAFFGHADIVRTLIEHGANTDATTRFGTSAQMWASARTFEDVVEYLENLQHPSRVKGPTAPSNSREKNTSGHTNLSFDFFEETEVQPSVDTSLGMFMPETHGYRKWTIAICAVCALFLVGATYAHFKLSQKHRSPTKVVPQAVATTDARPTQAASENMRSTPVVESEAKEEVDNHSKSQEQYPSNTRKTLKPITKITSTVPDKTEQSIATDEQHNIQPLRPIADSEIGPAPKVVIPIVRRAASSSPPMPTNNSQLITSGSSKSGKVIAWP